MSGWIARVNTDRRPLRAALTVLGCGVLALGASACESTEQESAKIGREGTKLIASAGALKIGAANHGVKVSDTTLLSVGGRAAVVLRLTSTTSAPQVNVPLLLSVTGTAGKVLYSNDTAGIDPTLQAVPLLTPHASAWWVDDQVLTSQPGGSVHVQVGTGHGRAPAGASDLEVATDYHLVQQAGVTVLEGTVRNHGKTPRTRVLVDAVATSAGKITAAGRALLNEVPSGSSTFQIFLVGKPASSKIELTAVPSAS